MTVDAHMHVGEFPLFDVRMDGPGLAATLARFDIDAGLVFCPENHLTRSAVEAVDAAYGLYWANPKMPGHLEEAEEYLGHPKFRGVKLHPLIDGYHPNDPIVHPLMELLVAKGLPALVHCGHPIFTLPWSIEELARSFPAATVVLGHMGHGNIVYINGAIDVAARNPNVYLETSGMPMHSKIKEGVERAGAHKVLYGSDAPFHDPSVEILKVRVSGLSDDLVERVLHTNSVEVFFGGVLPSSP
ncbi:MAG: amidohydrolase family protein [Actinomycetota bacterium]|nr:amidohydrolase family protein [Actinomycetota bacterium]